MAVFGIAAAILAPLGLNILTGVFRFSQDDALRRLAKAGDLERRIAEADTMEQKVEALRAEQKRLYQIVEFEAYRLTLESREEALREELSRLALEVDRIDRQLAGIYEERELLGASVESSPVHDEVRALHQRLHSYSRGEQPPGPWWLETYIGVVKTVGNMLPIVGSGASLDPSDDIRRLWYRWRQKRKYGNGSSLEQEGNGGQSSGD